MIRTRFLTLSLAVLSLAAFSCSKGLSTAEKAQLQTDTTRVGPDLAQVNPERLKPLTDVLRKHGIYPELYAISHFKASAEARTKNRIFDEWHAERLKKVDHRMRDEMTEYKYPDAKLSRQEECGTLRPAIAVNDTAENFTFARDLTPSQIIEIAKALNELQSSGIEFGFNGFDLNGCNLDEGSRQMDDYVISPLVIDAKAGDLYEFHYLGGCR